MKKISQITALLASLVVPCIAAAQAGIRPEFITPYSEGIKNVINNILVPVLMALAFVVFLWGVYKYFILGASEEKSRTEGKQFTFWGIIGFVIILSVWGIVNLFMSTLGLSAGTVPPFPTIGGSNNSGNMTPAQVNAQQGVSAALTAFNDCKSSFGPTSSNCTALGTAYTNAQNAYNTQYGTVNTDGTIRDNGACVATWQCVNGSECINGICASGMGVADGSACTSDWQCANGSSCLDNVCASGMGVSDGSACTSDWQCANGHVCSSSGVCALPVAASPYDTCMSNSGSSAEKCTCESAGGVWDPNSNPPCS